jgi:PhnB protein
MQTIVPYLTVKNAAEAIDFYVKALGAKEVSRAPAEDGKRLLHADLSINGGSVFLMDAFPEHAGNGCGAVHPPSLETPSATSVVVNFARPAEVDAAHRRAKDAGCVTVMEPQDAFWGARFAAVGDPYGHIWMLNAELPKKD